MKKRIIPNFSNYKIREDGVVLSKKKGYRNPGSTVWVKKENWKPLVSVVCTGTGYKLVTLISDKGERKNKRVHKLLMEAFVANPEEKEHVNHIDGNKLNNELSNLEWATSKENSQHSVDMGMTTFTYCEKPIVQIAVDDIFVRHFKSAREAHRITGIAYQNISKVLRGQRKTAGGFIWKYKLKEIK